MHAATTALDASGAAGWAYALDGRHPVFCLRSAMPLVGSDAPIQWVHVAYEGEWLGHHSGPFALTREKFASAIVNFERQINPVKLDFDHESEFAEPGVPIPARGWVHRLEIRSGADGSAHFWALVEFGPEAVARNKAGGYRYCSAVFDFHAIDRKTGEPIGLVLRSLALTDDPFIDGQEPIWLSSRAASAAEGTLTMSVAKSEFMRLVRQLEGDEITAEQASKLAAAAQAMNEALGTPASPAAPAAEPAPAAAPMAADKPDEDKPKELEDEKKEPEKELAAEPGESPADATLEALQALAEQHGMTLEEFIAALPGMLGAPDTSAAPLTAMQRELGARDHAIKALTKRATEAESALALYRKREATEAVEVLVNSGRLLDAARADFEDLYLSNRPAFDRMSAALPAVVPVGSHALASTPPTAESPAINEDDPEVRELRRWLSAASVPREKQDARIQKELAARRNTRV